MKKILAFFLMVLLFFVFLGCESQEKIASSTVITEIYERKFSEVSYEECSYILNKNTGKFHYKDCFAIKLMYETNKVYCNDERNSIIEHGYAPCLKCNP